MTNLTKAQRIQLFNALSAAFPGWDQLRGMVALQLERNLEDISPQSVIPTVVLNLIVWAQANGYLGELVAGALAHNPQNPQLKQFATTMEATAPAAPPPATPEGETSKEHYERLIWKAVAFAGTAEFRAEMMQREAAVCRVEFPEGKGQGTGFLIGPDLILTNYHVLGSFIDDNLSPDMVSVRFDYQATADGTKVSDGRVVKLASPDWQVQVSKVGELDYALVRLAEQAGEDKVAGAAVGATRGWLQPEAHSFSQGESVFVLQHPKAAPLKIAAGGVAKVQERRIHYLANTLDGSSGSPCFTSDWKLAALHRGGDSLANIGIPFSAIVPDLKAKNPALTFA